MHSYSYSYGYGKLSLESIGKSLSKIALKNRRAYERIENAAKYACKSKIQATLRLTDHREVHGYITSMDKWALLILTGNRLKFIALSNISGIILSAEFY